MSHSYYKHPLCRTLSSIVKKFISHSALDRIFQLQQQKLQIWNGASNNEPPPPDYRYRLAAKGETFSTNTTLNKPTPQACSMPVLRMQCLPDFRVSQLLVHAMVRSMIVGTKHYCAQQEVVPKHFFGVLGNLFASLSFRKMIL